MVAVEYVKANADELGMKEDLFDEFGVHVHVPEGAIPKDGPSAGLAILTSLVSILTKQKVLKRLAMTGEITLRGKLLPVGGIKEKILAAKRAGITDVILSTDNKKDIEEINEEYLNGLTFHFCRDVKEAMAVAF